MKEYVGYEGVKVLAVGDLGGDETVCEQCGDEVVGGRGCLPEKYCDGCSDDGIVDDGDEAGGVLVAEGEHGLMVVRVSDIGVCSFCVFTRSQAREGAGAESFEIGIGVQDIDLQR